MRLCGYLDWSADWSATFWFMPLAGVHEYPESDTAFFGVLS